MDALAAPFLQLEGIDMQEIRIARSWQPAAAAERRENPVSMAAIPDGNSHTSATSTLISLASRSRIADFSLVLLR